MSPVLLGTLIGFAVLLALLWKATPAIERSFFGIQARQERVRSQLEEARAALRALEEAKLEHERMLAQAREEAARLQTLAAEQAALIREDLEKRAQEQAERILARAEGQIELERQRAVQRLRQEIAEMTTEALEEMLRHDLDKDAQRALLRAAIAEVDVAPAKRPL